MDRVLSRFVERAQRRDAAVELNLAELYEKAGRDESIGMSVLTLIEGKSLTESTKDGTSAI